MLPNVVLANAAQREEDEKDKLRGEEADEGADDEDGEDVRDEYEGMLDKEVDDTELYELFNEYVPLLLLILASMLLMARSDVSDIVFDVMSLIDIDGIEVELKFEFVLLLLELKCI